jgi:hypothetical protein
VSEEKRPALRRLRDWAVSLREQMPVLLQTFHSRTPNRLSLVVRFTDEGVGLVTIYNNNGAAALQVWSKVFERRAPKSLARVAEIISPDTVGHGTYVRIVSDELLLALTDAYREASGT